MLSRFPAVESGQLTGCGMKPPAGAVGSSPGRRPARATGRARGAARRSKRDKRAGWAPATDEQPRDATLRDPLRATKLLPDCFEAAAGMTPVCPAERAGVFDQIRAEIVSVRLRMNCVEMPRRPSRSLVTW